MDRTREPRQPNRASRPGERLRRCATCESATPAGALVSGQCPTCWGQDALPLRGAGGRFLPGLPGRAGSVSS